MTEAERIAREVGVTVYRSRYIPERPFFTFSPEQLQEFYNVVLGKRREEGRVYDVTNAEPPDPVSGFTKLDWQ